MLNQHVKYLGHMSFHSKVFVQPPKHLTDYFTWITTVVGNELLALPDNGFYAGRV